MRDSIIHVYVNNVFKRTMSYEDAVVWAVSTNPDGQYHLAQDLVKDLQFQRESAPLSGTTLSPNSSAILYVCTPNMVNHLRF